jgi:uncharacterized protein YjbI with pentapeptide repeats
MGLMFSSAGKFSGLNYTTSIFNFVHLPSTSNLDKQATSHQHLGSTSTSTINHPRQNSKMATLNQVLLSGSTVTSKVVHKSKLIKCTLIRVTIHSSSISDSVLKNCSIYDCVIHTSKLYNCKIYGDKPLSRSEYVHSPFPPPPVVLRGT